ncbi:MAG TPA: sugar phosphate isomerase/epimerase family protein [Anaerolineae bacterium]|nr:sugar phosphate isomerase/epimerase family protein [Anaerolineae bacterium]HQH36962.1 sugar phosphate isomerase/epimerase family protein [Anaerolineae bacterium]
MTTPAPLQPEIGVSTAAFYPAYLTEDALTAAAKLGFPVTEVFLQSREEYTPDFGRTLDRRRRACGMRVHSLHLHNDFFELWSPYRRMLDEARARFRHTLDIAVRLEAQALTWHGIRFGFKNPAFVARFLDGVAWAAEQARTAGVTLCLENVSWCYLRTPEQIHALDEHGVPVGFTFDSFQAGETPTDPVALIHAMGGRLTTVHLADYDPAGPRHLPLGAGKLDWRAILCALDAVSYAGPLIIELANVEDVTTLRASRTFIEQQIAHHNRRD